MKNEALELTWPLENVAQITLTRAAEMNTLTHALLDGMEGALASLKGSGVRALVITGSGRAFCCGAHLDYFTDDQLGPDAGRSEEHTSELQSLMRISYAVFCLKKKNNSMIQQYNTDH